LVLVEVHKQVAQILFLMSRLLPVAVVVGLEQATD
jgi:hypothetical protein